MSKFLDFPQYIVNLGASIQQWKDELKGHLVRNGWQLIREGNDPFFFEVKPPATEAIGNANGYEIVRFDIDATTTKVTGYVIGTRFVKGKVNVSFGYYNAENKLTINGVTISNIGVGYYDNSNIRAVPFAQAANDYKAANPGGAFDGLTFTVNGDHIEIVQNSGPLVLTDAVASYVSIQESGYIPGTLPLYGSEPFSVTHDLVSGFVYYLSIHSRKVELATKTTAAFFGPIGAAWADNAQAVAATPPGLVPIELITYAINGDLNAAGSGVHTHGWGITANADYGSYGANIANVYSGTGMKDGLPLEDVRSFSPWHPRANFRGAGLSYARGGDDARYFLPAGVNIVGMGTVATATVVQGRQEYGTPALNYPDVYAFIRDATNESLHLGRVVSGRVLVTTLAGDNLTLSDATAFAPAGSVIVENEVIRYTAKAGNVLSGLTRGAYGSANVNHDAGAVAYPAMWFVKINGGAMSAGPVKPGGA